MAAALFRQSRRSAAPDKLRRSAPKADTALVLPIRSRGPAALPVQTTSKKKSGA